MNPMYASYPRPHRLSTILALYIVSPLAMNGLIFGMGWGTHHSPNPLLPPGWVVGAIWMLLFACMGVARWLLIESLSPWYARWVDGLALLCLLYPLYTKGLSSIGLGLVGAIVSAAFAAVVAITIAKASRPACALILAVLAWVLYAETALAQVFHH
jgi:tryptophan-rich sensory protein